MVEGEFGPTFNFFSRLAATIEHLPHHNNDDDDDDDDDDGDGDGDGDDDDDDRISIRIDDYRPRRHVNMRQPFVMGFVFINKHVMLPTK
ncbi:hypothetical protein BLOT_003276 [Blomia tropicalis]|nr:hypothetical protein BLOT_003276 [Blomia tropicalis]